MTDFFETNVENLDPKEEKKKSSVAAKKSKHKKSTKKRKGVDFDSSVIESSKDSSVEHKPIKKYCSIHGKCSRSTDNSKDLSAMSNKDKQKKEGF